jgi:DNA-binding response OmpR family regulator
MPPSILIVDDDALMRSFLATILKEDGYRVIEAGNGREGLERLEGGEFDLVITDLRMPELSGLDFMREARKEKPEIRWIIITAFGSIGNAVEAMKAGAADYLTKPLRDPDELRHVVRRVLREAEAEKDIPAVGRTGKALPSSGDDFPGGKHEGRPKNGPGGGPHHGQHIDQRFQRHGQRTGGPGDPSAQPAKGKTVRSRPLRGPLGNPAGKRALRP